MSSSGGKARFTANAFFLLHRWLPLRSELCAISESVHCFVYCVLTDQIAKLCAFLSHSETTDTNAWLNVAQDVSF